ncbi:multiple epidermal growth factor-like domains protein 6 [Porphyrio hochstetteri]
MEPRGERSRFPLLSLRPPPGAEPRSRRDRNNERCPLPTRRFGRPNVCAERELAIVGHRQPCVRAVTRTVRVWKQDCAGRRWCAGYERRTTYHTSYRPAYKVKYQTAYRCCPGWAQLRGDVGCLYPVCSHGLCFNGGHCIEGSSQPCRCPPGFQGPRCQYDLNECETGNGGCESRCCNTIGSFYCQCPAGLRLEQDGKACAEGSVLAPGMMEGAWPSLQRMELLESIANETPEIGVSQTAVYFILANATLHGEECWNSSELSQDKGIGSKIT